MPKEQNICTDSPSIRKSRIIAALYTPAVSVGEKNGYSLQHNLLLDGGRQHPSVTVAWDEAEGELGVVLSDLFCVAYEVAQMNYLLGPVAVDGRIHPGQGAMGVGKNQYLQCSVTLPFLCIY